MRRGSTRFFSEEDIELIECGPSYEHSKKMNLKNEIEKLETSKIKTEEHLVMYKPLVEQMQTSEAFSIASYIATWRCRRAINRLEEVVQELNSKIGAKKTELAGLENPSNQFQEPNYYQEVLECRMQ